MAAQAFGVGPLLGAAGAQRAGLERVPDVAAAVGGAAPGVVFRRDPAAGRAADALAALPQIVELNIGHFLVGEAIFVGLAESVRRMKMLMADARLAAGRA